MRFRPSYIAVVILSIFFIACHPHPQLAVARTNNSKFHEIPYRGLAAPLQYDTSSPQMRNIISQLDDYYRRQVRAGFNGSVLIGSGGKVIYERYFGIANRDRKKMLSPFSSCQLASVTKTFTGAAILYLYEHKYLALDAPVQNYLKEFPYPGITIRMLLDHRSGLPDYTKWVPKYKPMATPISNTEMMGLMMRNKPAVEFRPDSRFKYCNTNFAVLAMIIERVTEMSYSYFMSNYIFQPLGMAHTFVYNPATGLPADAAISYNYRWGKEPDMFADGVYGDKGIYSTPEDMYRWDQSFYLGKLLSNETIELAYGPCSFEKPGVKNYGLGWRMLCYANGNKVIYHNGWWHGNNTSFYRFIKDNMTIVILGNKYNKGIYHQAPVLFSIVKGIPVVNGFDTGD